MDPVFFHEAVDITNTVKPQWNHAVKEIHPLPTIMQSFHMVSWRIKRQALSLTQY